MFTPLFTTVAAVRSVAAYLLVSLYVMVAAPVGLVVTLMTRRIKPLYWLGRLGVRLGLATVGIRFRVAGAECVEADRASVYCVNHASNLEPPVLFLALSAVHPKLRILYKAEIHKLPLLSQVFDMAGFVPIERRNREQSLVAIDTAAAALREGNSFLIFPEGTRSQTGELLPFKKGGFVMAIRGGATIVPLTILGTRQAMQRGSRIIRPVQVSVRIGKPIDPKNFGFDERERLITTARAEMERLLAAGPIR